MPRLTFVGTHCLRSEFATLAIALQAELDAIVQPEWAVVPGEDLRGGDRSYLGTKLTDQGSDHSLAPPKLMPDPSLKDVGPWAVSWGGPDLMKEHIANLMQGGRVDLSRLADDERRIVRAAGVARDAKLGELLLESILLLSTGY